jgi:hypothetical protein
VALVNAPEGSLRLSLSLSLAVSVLSRLKEARLSVQVTACVVVVLRRVLSILGAGAAAAMV